MKRAALYMLVIAALFSFTSSLTYGLLQTTSITLLLPPETFDAVYNGQTIVFRGRLIDAATTNGIPDATVKITYKTSFNDASTLVSGKTDSDGYYSIPWTVDLDTLLKTESQISTEDNRIKVTVNALFEGDEQYKGSTSNAQTFDIITRVLKLVVERGERYTVGERAKIIINVRDSSNNRPIDPDRIEVMLNNKELIPEKVDIGRYFIVTEPLRAGTNLLAISAEKDGYGKRVDTISIETRVRETILRLDTEEVYMLGDRVVIRASLFDKLTETPLTGDLRGNITAPDGKIYRLEFVNNMASFILNEKHPAGSWMASVNFVGNEAYASSSANISFTVLRVTMADKAEVSDVLLTDSNGLPLKEIFSNESVIIKSKIRGVSDAQNAVYIIQIKDSEGIIAYLSWVKLTLTRERVGIDASWIPAEGDYEIEILVWSSISNPEPLAPPFKMKITVF